jgi:hypothetical protein
MNVDVCSRISIVAANHDAAAAFNKLRREMRPVVFERIRVAEAAFKRMLDDLKQVWRRALRVTCDI